MSQQTILIIVVLLCIVGILLLSPGARRFAWKLIVMQPNLEIGELPALFDGQHFQIERNPSKKMPGADKSIQAISNRASVIYHSTKQPKGLVETVDISYPGKFGMIFTLANGKVTRFQRIGGATRNYPELSIDDQDAVDQFMVSLRDRLSKA